MHGEWVSIDKTGVRVRTKMPDLSPFEIPDAVKGATESNYIIVELRYLDSEDSKQVPDTSVWLGKNSRRVFRVKIPVVQLDEALQAIPSDLPTNEKNRKVFQLLGTLVEKAVEEASRKQQGRLVESSVHRNKVVANDVVVNFGRWIRGKSQSGTFAF